MATKYERRRLENIRRNDEMMASLNVHAAKASLLSAAATKRPRDEDDDSKKKKKKETTTTTKPNVNIRKSLRIRGLNPAPHKPSPLPLAASYIPVEEEEESSLNKLVETLLSVPRSNSMVVATRRSSRLSNLASVSSSHHIKKKRVSSKVGNLVKDDCSSFDTGLMSLEPCNVARVVPGRVSDVKFLPCENVNLLAAGDKHGNVGFWNLDCQDDDGVHLFRPHSSSVSSLVFQQNSFSRLISSSYDGLIRLMDVEKSVFDLVYSSGDAIFSLSQRPNDEQSLFFSEGYGMLNIWDLRAGKSVFLWDLHHGHMINSIDFNPRNLNVMATSSTDGTACLWDLRSMMGSKKPKRLRTVNHHSKAVHSAYFSPSGLLLATTSVDNYLGILSGPGLEDTSMIYHENLSTRGISAFRGVWGWDDSYIFVANRSRGIDVISPKLKRTVKELHNPLMKTIPSRIHCHPLHVGMLAGSTAGGQVYVWTRK